MENNANKVNLMSEDYDCLPTLDSEDTVPQRQMRRRLGKMKLKAISLPVDLKSTEFKKLKGYNPRDDYHMFEKLGVGAYSEVRKAADKKTGELVAIKIAKGSTSSQLLKGEADLLSSFTSEYLPKFYRFEQDIATNRAFMIMEYIPGIPLDEYIQKNGVMSEEEADCIIVQLIKAVESLHKRGIAHRDIKPQNILITEDKKIKLIDFNISKQTKRKGSDSDEEAAYKFK